MMKTVGEDTHENSYQNNQDRSPVSLFLAAIDPPVFAQTTKCSTPDRLLEISERVFGFFVIFGFMFLFRIAGMVYGIVFHLNYYCYCRHLFLLLISLFNLSRLLHGGLSFWVVRR
ncbi:hypothetical protein RND81_08G129600 [Saponaria officinalis]|uniref:Transmembrane protein n=1 Tax=Saponaria officinalis TaxID=3572 RepID=A0AAW1J7J4_SAPOF